MAEAPAARAAGSGPRPPSARGLARGRPGFGARAVGAGLAACLPVLAWELPRARSDRFPILQAARARRTRHPGITRGRRERALAPPPRLLCVRALGPTMSA